MVIPIIRTLPVISNEAPKEGDIVYLISKTEKDPLNPREVYLGKFIRQSENDLRVVHAVRLNYLGAHRYSVEDIGDLHFPDTFIPYKLQERDISRLKTLDKYVSVIGIW